MEITYGGVAILVADLAAARRFYERDLGQAVLMDNGPHVAYRGGFSLWQADHAREVVFGPGAQRPAPGGADRAELYFETDAPEAACRALELAGAPVVHPLMEQPWGQRVARFRDPDGHLLELAEPLEAVVRRLHGEGLDEAAIAGRTHMPPEMVRAMLGP